MADGQQENTSPPTEGMGGFFGRPQESWPRAPHWRNECQADRDGSIDDDENNSDNDLTEKPPTTCSAETTMTA